MRKVEEKVLSFFGKDKEVIRAAKEANADINKFDDLVKLLKDKKRSANAKKIGLEIEELAVLIMDLVDRGILKENMDFTDFLLAYSTILIEDDYMPEPELKSVDLAKETILSGLEEAIENIATTDLELLLLGFIYELVEDDIVKPEDYSRLYDLLEDIYSEVSGESEESEEEEERESIEESKKIKWVVRHGKKIRKVFCSPGYKAVDGHCVRMSAVERLRRRRAAIKRARRMKSKIRMIIRRRMRSLKKRKMYGLD